AIVKVRSGLPDVAATVRTAQHQARVTIPALMVPLGALGLVVLWMALGSAVEQRRPEVAVARLRGRGARGAQLHLVRELLTTVLIGVPAGVVLAFGVSWPARRLMLPGDVPWEIRPPVLLGLLLAVAVLSATVVLVTVRVSREPIVDLMRRIPARRPGWGLGTADAVVATVSASILVSFLTGRLTGPIALVAPALLALGAGLVLARLLVPAATSTGRGLLARGTLGTGVGLLQLARRPGVRATTALLTVAAAILVFAGDAVAVGNRVRAAAAAQRIGAPVVVTVAGGGLSDLRRALAAARVPDREVTPVVVQRGVARDDQTVLYVDPARFGAIAAFADRTAAHDALRRLSVPPVDPIRFTGSSISMTISTDGLYEGAERGVDLSLVVLHVDGTVSAARFGRLPTGTSRPRRVTARVDCATGCTATGWTMRTTPANAGSGRVVLTDLRTDSGDAVPLGTRDDWQGIEADDSALESVASSAGSLTLSVDNSGASELLLQHRWVPATLPAVVTGSLPPGSRADRFAGSGLDGVTRPMQVADRLQWLPATGPNAAIADLALAERSGSALAVDSVLQLWFARDDAAALGRLRSALHDEGMTVSTVARTSDARREIDESAAAWSLELGILVGAACLVVALLGLAIAAAGTWRARARDLAVLRLNGVPLRHVRRIAVAEQVPPTVAAVALGSMVGVLAAHYALPTLPLLATDPDVDVVDLSVAWLVVLVLAGTTVVLLAAFGWAAARAVATAATPARVTDTP
ncbi:MAG TPA: FtsX-like permease family protein, partial [Marmoricola sp.]|nr:FtsX-like permease family protein [Marmoricola sp.]